MKTQYFKGTPEKLKEMLEECIMLGYEAEIVGDELLVYYGKRQVKTKKQKKKDAQAERWSKRERNFGYTRK